MTNSCFVTFEGGDGAGKSTQVGHLVRRLEAAGIGVLATREPGGSPFAETVRRLILDPATPAHGPLSETLLFMAARADHIEKTIRPALADGRWVVCDRFVDSTRVYQSAAGGLASDRLAALEAATLDGLLPDLTVILDLPVDEGLRRIDDRAPEPGTDPYETRDRAFHEALREGFLAIAKREPNRCIVVDGTMAEADIAEHIWQALARRLSPAGI